jgi:hypothetical protein
MHKTSGFSSAFDIRNHQPMAGWRKAFYNCWLDHDRGLWHTQMDFTGSKLALTIQMVI